MLTAEWCNPELSTCLLNPVLEGNFPSKSHSGDSLYKGTYYLLLHFLIPLYIIHRLWWWRHHLFNNVYSSLTWWRNLEAIWEKVKKDKPQFKENKESWKVWRKIIFKKWEDLGKPASHDYSLKREIHPHYSQDNSHNCLTLFPAFTLAVFQIIVFTVSWIIFFKDNTKFPLSVYTWEVYWCLELKF